jgi:hypothetical protein
MTLQPTKHFISIHKQRILAGMPKVKPAVIQTKKPVPLVKPIPPVSLATGSLAKSISALPFVDQHSHQ